jgi:hypothetical protein
LLWALHIVTDGDSLATNPTASRIIAATGNTHSVRHIGLMVVAIFIKSSLQGSYVNFLEEPTPFYWNAN